MDKRKCKGCGEEFKKWAEFCSNCGEAMENYSRPAGFWIRVGAHIIDTVVFIPLVVVSFWNMFRVKSMFVLVLISVPGLIYKPLMESYFGATLGKMACRIKVVYDNGKKLSLASAYARFLPFLASAVITLVSQVILFSSPQFESVRSFVELGQAQEKGFLHWLGIFVSIFIMVECVFAAFTFRKRAIHDMLAESFCVYKEPGD